MLKQLASQPEIGRRLQSAKAKKEALEQRAIPPEELTSAAGAEVSAWYRWIKGEFATALLQVPQVALALDISPDELLLKVPPGTPAIIPAEAEKLPHFTAADFENLAHIRDVVHELTALGGDSWAKRPAEILLEHIQNIRELMLREQQRASVSKPSQLQAHKKSKAEPVGRAAEQMAPYGLKPKKR
jgi:hypothetical protein